MLLAWVLLAGGCASGKSYRLGREAESLGRAHIAYDYYCKAARRKPDNAAIAEAIKRVAPTAATYWYSQARIAWSEERYEDAWRQAMRALEIRPDHADALAFVRRIETQRPDIVATARRDWLRRGSRPYGTLRRDGAPAHEKTERAASVGKAPEGADAPKKVALADKTTESKENSKAVKTPGRPRLPLSEAVARATAPDHKSVVSPQASRATAVGEKPRPASPPPPVVKPTKPPRHAVPDTPKGYLYVCTLSKRDKRYDRRTKPIDGIVIRLRDTDGDPDVDLDLYEGERRVQKIRDLRPGRSKIFRGRSGRWYRLTVLKIFHHSRSVRLGIKPG